MKKETSVWMTAALVSAGLVLTGAGTVRAAGLAGPTPAGYVQDRGWEAPPPELDEVSRRGFHDGIEGARKDWDNHRHPDPHNRDEFRHPHVADRDKEAYRRGFERGYQVGVDHLYGEHR